MFERVQREPTTSAEGASGPIGRRRAPYVRGPLTVGAVDDAAEREADRVADRVSRRVGESVAPTSSPLLTAHGSSRIVRRAPYLSHEGDRIYKETNHGDKEFACLGTFMFLPKAKVFIPYSAVHELRDLAEEIHRGLPKGGPVRAADTRKANRKAAASPTGAGRRPGRSLSTSKTGFGLNFGDEHKQVSDRMRDEAKRAEKAEKATKAITLRKRIHAALDHIYCWYGADSWEDVKADLKLDQYANVMMYAIEKGPVLLATGHGSRLPPASGKLYSTPARTRDELLAILGVERDRYADFEQVEVVDLKPKEYKTKRDELAAAGANMFRLEDASRGLWIFYTSNVATGRSANSRIQVAGSSFSDDEFAALDPATEVDFVRSLATSYANLRYDADSGWIDGRTMTISQDRGPGQAKAMLFWNALGAAAYANRFLGRAYDLRQNWEWLHIRGAQIGGQTEMGNLVPGFFTTNSAMIPYETAIKKWASEDPVRFFARFQAVGGHGVFAATIRLSIKTVEAYDPVRGEDRGHESLGVMESPLLDFDPIGGRVVDRLAGEFSKRQVDQSVRVPRVPMDLSQ